MHMIFLGSYTLIISLLSDNTTFPMPPLPFWIRGKRAIADFLDSTIFEGDSRGRWKLILVRANGQPGVAFYRIDEATRIYHPYALQVLTIHHGGLVADVTTFGMPALFGYFQLPESLPS